MPAAAATGMQEADFIRQAAPRAQEVGKRLALSILRVDTSGAFRAAQPHPPIPKQRRDNNPKKSNDFGGRKTVLLPVDPLKS